MRLIAFMTDIIRLNEAIALKDTSSLKLNLAKFTDILYSYA